MPDAPGEKCWSIQDLIRLMLCASTAGFCSTYKAFNLVNG